MQKPPKIMAIVIAVIGAVLAGMSMYSLVPRIRLVEAVSLFATSFAAGAAFAVTLTSARGKSG